LAYYVNDCGYEFERIEAQTWRLVSNHYAPIHTGVNRPELDWARDAIRSPYSAVFWNVGWYTHNADTDVYQREGGHWVTMVGYGHDGAAHDPGYFIIHDPSPRCGTSFRNEYVLPTMITSGTMTGYNPGLPQNAAGYHLLSGWPISSAGNCAILDAVVVLEMLPVSRIPGDTNGDGRVDEADAKTLATHWGQPGGWAEGDFNNDGLINALDAAILAANWGHGVTTEQGNRSTAVPEPSVLAMLACLVIAAGGRCRRVVAG
jgi:hypothetical protein